MAVIHGSTTFAQAQVMQSFVATLEERREDLVSSVLSSHPTLELFASKAKSGSGQNIRVNVQLTGIDNTYYTDDNGTFNTDVSDDAIQSAVYNWPKPFLSSTTIKFIEIEKNKGKETQLINLVEFYITEAKNGHTRKLSEYLWNAPQAFVSDEQTVIPLQVLVDDTAPLGGLDPATWDAWKSVVRTYDADAPGADPIVALEEAADDVAKFGERPTHWIFGRNAFRALKAAAREQNINMQPRDEKQELSFRELTFEGYVVRLDHDAPADMVLGLNDKYLINEYLNDNFMRAIDPNGGGTNPGNLNKTALINTIWQIGTTKRNAHVKITGNWTKTPVTPAP